MLVSLSFRSVHTLDLYGALNLHLSGFIFRLLFTFSSLSELSILCLFRHTDKALNTRFCQHSATFCSNTFLSVSNAKKLYIIFWKTHWNYSRHIFCVQLVQCTCITSHGTSNLDQRCSVGYGQW